MPNNETSLFEKTEGDSSAIVASTSWRRKKAKEQPRDANGRWISDGARVTYLDEPNSRMVAGTVVSTKDGNVVVERELTDGTITTETIPNSTVEVVSSKARIPRPGTEYKAKKDFGPVLKSKTFKNSLETEGQATVYRADGYRLEATQADGETIDGTSDKKNPISYQLFAPSGKSLGTYSEQASGDFNAMADEDKNPTQGEPTEDPAAETPAETSGEDTMFSVVRVSRNGTSAIFKNDQGYVSANLVSLEAKSGDSLLDFASEGAWRRPTKQEASDLLSVAPNLSLIPVSMTASAEKVTPYRVPAKIKSAITAALEGNFSSSEEDVQRASSLASSEAVSLDEVRWIKDFLTRTEEAKNLAGGAEGDKWATKILEGFSDTSKHDFASDKLAYFALGDGQDGWKVSDIIAVDFATDEVYTWGPDGFELSNQTVPEVEAPVVLPIDEFSAEELALWVTNGREGGTFNLADIDPVERNLVSLALSEMDMEELDTIGAIVAAGGAVVDVDGYSPAERSQNAKNQPRAGGGRFGSKGSDAPAPVQEEALEVKATLPEELPLVENPGARIEEWLAVAPVTAAGAPSEEEGTDAPVETSEEEPEAAEAETEAETSSEGESQSLYFAVVDEVDRTSVLDVVAITKNDLGQSEAWKRNLSDWVPAPEYLAKFQSATPPAVVELKVPEPATMVLGQVDSYDSERSSEEEVPEETAPEAAPEAAPAPAEQAPVTASSGFALDGGKWGIFSVDDLENIVTVYEMSSESTKKELRGHIRKRAFALNRMDMVPEDIRTATLAERGEQFLNTSPLYGEHGEVIVAAGVPGIADTPSDWAAAKRLQNYWTRGKGALKIRWGTPGDLTRAHRHLAKYVGPQRAWGLAQKYHKSIFGVYNHTHDVATGQYRPRKRKRR